LRRATKSTQQTADQRKFFSSKTIFSPLKVLIRQCAAGQKKPAKQYIIKTADRMIELNTNSQETWAPASSQSSHFDNEVEAYLACLCRNMFISQLTLYDENQLIFSPILAKIGGT
jgi:hypothetical protein